MPISGERCRCPAVTCIFPASVIIWRRPKLKISPILRTRSNTTMTNKLSVDKYSRDEPNNFIVHLGRAPVVYPRTEHNELIPRRSVVYNPWRHKRHSIVPGSSCVSYNRAYTQIRTLGPVCRSGEHFASQQHGRPDSRAVRVAHSSAVIILSAPSLSRWGSSSSTGSQ